MTFFYILYTFSLIFIIISITIWILNGRQGVATMVAGVNIAIFWVATVVAEVNIAIFVVATVVAEVNIAIFWGATVVAGVNIAIFPEIGE